MHKPRIAITIGDPAGVGPEVVVGAWSDPRIHRACTPLAIGHPAWLREAVQMLGLPHRVVEIGHPDEARPGSELIPCLPVGDDQVLGVQRAKVDSRGGQAAFDALERAAELALSGEVDAITTAPLNKAALHAAGHKVPGHTELLASFCGVEDVAMMLYLPPSDVIRGAAGLGVVHVTLHTALREVSDMLTTDRIRKTIRLADGVMHKLLSNHGKPRVGVCAFNPHAGEQGLFGHEEQQVIAPAVEAARADGIDVAGPAAADTLMPAAAQGEFDVVVAMYHDQGHIALKLLDMHHAVNTTLGLPIIRTSVAHGTAFDLAWQGKAETSGMVSAIQVAAGLAAQSSGVPLTPFAAS